MSYWQPFLQILLKLLILQLTIVVLLGLGRKWDEQNDIWDSLRSRNLKIAFPNIEMYHNVTLSKKTNVITLWKCCNNMMYHKKDEKVFRVLNNYDLAIFTSNNTPSSKTCTGTRPFMAIDLLGKPTDMHWYHHNLELLFYVIVYVTSRYHEGQEINDPPLQDWEELREVTLKAAKKAFLSDMLPP